jgi:hypothetical protein
MNEKQEAPAEGGGFLEQEALKEKVEDSTVASTPPTIENLVTKDGFKLHPQPTSDPLDPLNWSSFQKHSILAVVMFKYVLDNGGKKYR